MASDGKIVIDIVLDDGSIVKGLGRIQKEVKKTGEEGGKDLKTIGDVLGTDIVSTFTSKLKNIPVATATIALGFAAVGLAIKEAFDLTVEGEKIKAIEKQFENLAEAAGLSGRALESSLKQAAGGLIDTTDLLATARGALIEFGDSASRLPELLNVSRQATIALGGDVNERFQGIIQGIEATSQKQLKAQGIFIDVDKALKDYAKTLGLASSELNQAQKQQALLNAVIEQGGAKFKDAQGGLVPISVAIKRIGVNFKEAFEETAKSFNDKFGPTIAKALTAVANFTEADNVKNAPSRIQDINKELSKLRGVLGTVTESDAKVVQREIDQLELKKSKLEEILRIDTQAKKEEIETAKIRERSVLSPEQIQDIKNRNNEIASIRKLATQQEIANEEARLAGIIDVKAREELETRILNDKLKALEEEKNLELNNIANKYSTEKGFTDAQRAQAELNIKELYKQKEIALTDAAEIKKQQVINQRQKELEGIIKSGLSSTFQSVGASLQKGTNSFEAFGNGIIGILGDILIHMGEGLVTASGAIELFAAAINFPIPGSGIAAAAAGAGLIIFGSILKSSVGKGGAGGGVSSAGGGGISSNIDTATSQFTPTAQLERQAPGTSIAVNIQGDVLDSEESGLRIVNLLNSAFDQKGVVVRGASV